MASTLSTVSTVSTLSTVSTVSTVSMVSMVSTLSTLYYVYNKYIQYLVLNTKYLSLLIRFVIRFLSSIDSISSKLVKKNFFLA